MREDRSTTPRFLFVGGLHRSGTSMIYRALGTDPNVSIFRNTGVIEDEGQFLQDVFPRDATHGGPGRFAFDPSAHLTESCSLVDEARQTLFDSWARHWDVRKDVLAEKSPANMVRSRFLQSVFPESAFLFVVRHPIAVTMATSKWTGAYMRDQVRHWCAAHSILMQDVAHLRRYLILRYEDVIQDPSLTRYKLERLLARELDIRWPEMRADVNARYFGRWKNGDYHLKAEFSPLKRELKRLRNQVERMAIAIRYEGVVGGFGYSLSV